MADILDTLSKLMAHERSARQIGSLDEANAFAEKISALLIKHKISIAEVDQKTQQKVSAEKVGVGAFDAEKAKNFGVKSRGKRVAWIEELAAVIAQAHFCRILVAKRTSSIWFVGKPTDREVTEFLFAVLTRQIDEHVDKEYRRQFMKLRQQGRSNEMHGWRASFLKACVARIAQRFAEIRAQQVHGNAANALVRAADAEVDEWLMQRYRGSKSTIGVLRGGRVTNQQGVVDGRTYADNLNLNANGIKSGQVKPQKALSA